MRSPILVAAAALALASAACTTPDRDFPEDEAQAASTSVTSGGPGSTTGSGDGGGGEGTGGETSTPTSSGAQGGGGSGDCGNGTLDEGEACDEDTDLCNGCQVDCPSGWFAIGDSCFAVALNDVQAYDGLVADAKCGALDVGASGHRAHAATLLSFDEIDSLATRCPEPGCWLGYFALGPPGDGVFTAPATGETLFATPPWADGEPTLGDSEICLRLVLDGDGFPVLSDEPCSNGSYFACELETTFGQFADCHDDVLDPGEECDDQGDDTCLDCDRRCPEDWKEDPRTHLCLRAIDGPQTWSEAESLCLDQAGRPATPDEVADVRIASIVSSDGWLGLEANGIIDPPIMSWRSGEPFDFDAGTYPLPADAETAGDYGVLVDGQIVFDDPAGPHAALCERFDPDG